VEVAVAGGVDGYLEADTLDALEADRRLTREGVRGGFTPGEAAGAVVLASDAALQRAAAAPLAQVAGVATRIEQRSASDDAGLLGEALTEAVDAVCADLAGALVDAVYCDINGERWRAEEWGFASLRLGRLFRDASRYVSASGEWGDVGAATGALGCVLAVEAMRRGYARGPRALLWGASWSGLRGALLLTPAR
jgi:3-oxoacyl-[acyl-carrier-protein] synthase-1